LPQPAILSGVPAVFRVEGLVLTVFIILSMAGDT
jgi:hypothetical protein